MSGAAVDGVWDRWAYTKQAVASIDQAPPVQNTWYTVLNTVKCGRILFLAAKHDNTDSTAKAINMRVTIDGVTLTAASDATGNDNTPYYFYLDPTANALLNGTTVYNAGYYVDLRGNSIKVEVRQTGAPGTAEHLYGYVQYELLRRV